MGAPNSLQRIFDCITYANPLFRFVNLQFSITSFEKSIILFTFALVKFSIKN